MFVPPPHAALTERQQQQSRGYVLGLILLILFLSSRDFSPPSRRRVEAAQGAREGLVRHREDVKDRLIVDLSASNERLELENRRLKVAAIGLAGSLRSLGRHEMADAYNLTGVGGVTRVVAVRARCLPVRSRFRGQTRVTPPTPRTWTRACGFARR